MDAYGMCFVPRGRIQINVWVMGTSIRSSAVFSTIFRHGLRPLISQKDRLDLGTHVLPEDHENHK